MKNDEPPWFRKRQLLFLLVLTFTLALGAIGCGDDDDDDDDNDDTGTEAKPRFEQAAAMDANWCLETQMDLSALEGTDLGPDQIDVTVIELAADLGMPKATIEPDDDAPIHIISFIDKMTNTQEPDAPDPMGKLIACKVKSLDGIERGLNIDLPGKEGTCRQMNQRALDWALGQLTEEEKTRYESERKKLTFADDVLGEVGGEWYPAPIQFTETGDGYSMASLAMLIPYDDYPELPDEIKGVHYCKMMPPSQVLFWLLHRAFWDNPLGGGPDDVEDAKLLVHEGECQLVVVTSPGSCIFDFTMSQQTYCEEWTGADYDEAGAKEKCADRTNGVFSSALCSERTEETKDIDGDGEYKGVCVIDCGEPSEYRWHVYSEPEGQSFDTVCPNWFPI